MKGEKCVKVKVVKVHDNESKILKQLIQNPEGLRVNSISKYSDLNQRTVYRILNKLKEKDLIENIFPIWKIVNGRLENCIKLSNSSNIFELHNLSYVLKLIKVPDWWKKRKPRLMKLKDWNFTENKFGKNNSNPSQQIANENFVIQTYPESIIIISRKRYYSNNPYETITQGISDVMDIINYLEERFKFKLFPEGLQALEIRNNDFNRIKDHLAEHCKKEGNRFLVELDKNRKVWVDYSEPFGKEANYPEGQEILEKVTKDHLLNKPMLNSELQQVLTITANQISQITNNQEIFDKNISLHQEVLREIRDAIRELKEEIKKK